jgi:hypothetical protein
MRKILILTLLGMLILSLFSGCGSVSGQTGTSAISTVSGPDKITLSGSTAKYSGTGVVINGNVITINAEGEYYLTGKLDDGQIVVNTGETAQSVYLYLENADITCLTAPAIYVLQAKKLHIVLPEGTSNRIVSGKASDMDSFDKNANGGAIFGEDDIDIEGEGSLEICGYINNGITGKDDVQIEGGTISITAANNGIKGSESVTVSGGSLTVTCGNDGLKSTSADKEGKGFVQIDGGSLNFTVGGDGISAETELVINGGEISITSTGDSLLSSCKAIKANNTLTINGGTLTLSSDDNTISSKEAVFITDGQITAASSSRKGIHAEEKIRISGGSIEISATEEGIQTKGDVELTGGTIRVSSEEDGIKAGDKGDGTTAPVGTISISGGDVVLFSAGDPMEAKLSIVCSGGQVFGTGSPKNAKGLDPASEQAYAAVNLSGKEGDTIRVSGASVERSETAARDYSYVFFTSPDLVSGEEYTVEAGSSSAAVKAK